MLRCVTVAPRYLQILSGIAVGFPFGYSFLNHVIKFTIELNPDSAINAVRRKARRETCRHELPAPGHRYSPYGPTGDNRREVGQAALSLGQ